ncbi:hypothetical protein TNCV_1453121 [Trichonephila clavipes]|nr:hypothetical protein TNCV_1453121 [Trichonephila clavipes]
MPDEEVINNGKTRKREERVRKVFVPGGLGRKRQLQVIRTRVQTLKSIPSFHLNRKFKPEVDVEKNEWLIFLCTKDNTDKKL